MNDSKLSYGSPVQWDCCWFNGDAEARLICLLGTIWIASAALGCLFAEKHF
ncbi:MAG TPA: hypothetical protein VKP61_14530 [Candidatus Acidoferrum sp.]|nr:hypothetical protein [Candidatus Acidoferrum sp.]